MVQYPQRVGEEDCRDYIRTGRCKYGEACKYHHPIGNERSRIDPDEPAFPSRPNEPVCRYYMKNGTCKFGQRCKFHHPFCPAIQMRLSSFEDNQNTFFQSLPQRPGEPNCAFFMKNGTCKYGTVCKFHHPSGSRHSEQRREEFSSLRSERSVSAGTHVGNLNETVSQYHIDLQNVSSSDKKQCGGLNSRVDSPSLTSSSVSSSYGTNFSFSEQEHVTNLQTGFDDPWATCRNSTYDNPQCTGLRSLVHQTQSRPSTLDAHTQSEYHCNISEGEKDPLDIMTSSLLSMLDFEDDEVFESRRYKSDRLFDKTPTQE